MIEITQTYDLVPGNDPQAYAALVERTLALLRKAPGFVEVRANRNLLGSPQVRITTMWRSLADWAALRETPELQALEAQFARHVANSRAELWGPSPFLREPLRADR